MRRQRWIHGGLLLVMASACGDDSSALAAGGSSSSTGAETEAPAPLCLDGGPLMVGNAPWAKAPFAPPGDMGEGGSDDAGGEDDAGAIFLTDPDGGGVSFECDIFAQDCPPGEKCVPWADDGGPNWNATRCSPIAEDPAGVGQPCTVEGGPTSGIDDCSPYSICWDVDRANEGTCISQCMGDQADPLCHGDQFCLQNNEAALAVCMPWSLCDADGRCQCLCPNGSDPDCGPEQCVPAELGPPDRLTSEPPVHLDEEPATCPDSFDPVVLYMSNDDSNSQASPALARRTILEGRVVDRDRIRIHEFLNYFDLSGPSQSDLAAEVGIEMRRTDAELGEFTLVLRAQGRRLEAAERAPMNLVFSLDTSGSMNGEPMELLKDSMATVAGELRAGDVISVVPWSSTQTIVLSGYPVTGPDDPELLGIIEGLQPGGSTDLHGGLLTAYALAFQHHIDDGINRVILVSDGGANTGITDIDLIASQAKDWDGEGTYLVGVGVGSSSSYSDQLMDEVTDAGKGAYMFIDNSYEAQKQLGQRFLANVAVSARNVRMELTLPWYFGIKRFHGEEISSNPSEVEPQHLAPNDAMVFHQIISACDPSLITTCDAITARVEYYDPLTGTVGTNEHTATIESLVEQDTPRLHKADVVVGYAKALVVIDHLVSVNDRAQAVIVAQNMHAWAQEAADHLGDPEVQEIATLMGEYAHVVAP